MTDEHNHQQSDAQAFLLKTKAGQWAFEVEKDGEILGGGGGYADEFEALEGAQDAFPYLHLKAVIGRA